MQVLNLQQNLKSATKNCPLYNVEVKSKNNDKIKVADPSIIRVLIALMNQHAAIGGAASHWGGPSAFAEIFASLHAIFFKEKEWFNSFNFVNDAGHAENCVYATRALYGFDNMTLESIKSFRSLGSKLTGHAESHLNPAGVLISNGPLGSSLAQAQGLAMGDKIKKNSRTTICTISDGALMEGEVKEALASIPGLTSRGILNPFLMIISFNNTKLSGRIDVDSFSINPTLQSLKDLGWEYIFVEDGNNLQSVYTNIEEALLKLKRDSNKPIALICKTIKGYSVKSTEKLASGGHGYPLKAYDDKLIDFLNEITANNLPQYFKDWAQNILDHKDISSKSDCTDSNSKPKQKVQEGVAKALIKKASEGYPIFSISSDLAGSTGLAKFQKEFKKQYLDIGISESNMISTAIGLSKSGFIPIVDTFAQFAITKGSLPLMMAGLSKAPIIGIFSHIGFQDAADGASHQATTYISSLASIPNLDLVVLSSARDAYQYVGQAISNFANDIKNNRTPSSTIFFLGREKYPEELSTSLDYEYKKPQILRQGKDLILVSCGALIQHAIKAAEELTKDNINCTVINQNFINNFDLDIIANQLIKNKNKLITIEGHQLIGGMGSILIHKLQNKGYDFKSKSLGINGTFGQSSYTANELYIKHNLDSSAIVKASLNF